jgi:hypothetical protein
MSVAGIARLRITLDDSQTGGVLRRIEMPLTLRLDRSIVCILRSRARWADQQPASTRFVPAMLDGE